jgi:hypothetical protein
MMADQSGIAIGDTQASQFRKLVSKSVLISHCNIGDWRESFKGHFRVLYIEQEELLSCSSDYSTRWLAIK